MFDATHRCINALELKVFAAAMIAVGKARIGYFSRSD